MARKLLQKLESDRHTVGIYRDAEWDEFVAVLKNENGKELSTYHTDDKQDAIQTARRMLAEADLLING